MIISGSGFINIEVCLTEIKLLRFIQIKLDPKESFEFVDQKLFALIASYLAFITSRFKVALSILSSWGETPIPGESGTLMVPVRLTSIWGSTKSSA